jgi:hypothetical protein
MSVNKSFKLHALALGITLACNGAHAANTELASILAGSPNYGMSNQPSLSADGSKLAFSAVSTRFINDGVNTGFHILVKDLNSGNFVRASANSQGTAADAMSLYPNISASGRYVVYESFASNLAANDSDDEVDVYWHDLQTGETRLVSENNSGQSANGQSREAVVSEDGRYVAFSSLASNLGSNNGKRQVYLKDMQTNTTSVISLSSLGAIGDGDSFAPAISADGRYITFSSIANNLDNLGAHNKYDVYLHDRINGSTERLGMATHGGVNNGQNGQASISDDGNVIAFISSASNLIDNDTNALLDVFVLDRQSGSIERIQMENVQPNGASMYPKISNNGRFVAIYSSANNLVNNDNNGNDDLFIYDRFLKTLTLASIDNNGNQLSSNVDIIADINGDGTMAAFAAFNSLDANDTNNTFDIYLRHLDPPANVAPFAKAFPVETQVCSNGGAYVTLDASQSYDPDNQNLSFSWNGSFGTTTGAVVSVFLEYGNHDIRLDVIDSDGGNSTDIITVAVIDNQAPTVSADAAVTLEATSTQGAAHTVGYDANDNCALDSVSVNPTPSSYPLGATDVSVTAFDVAGHSASDQTRVTVRDTTAPTLTIPNDIIAEAVSANSAVNIGQARGNDIFPVSLSHDAPALFPLGDSIVNWTALDANGNSTSAQQRISLRDTTAPQITAGNVTLEATSRQGAAHSLAYNTSDSCIGCGNISVSLTPNLNTFPMGQTQVSILATDHAGNQSEKEVQVTVQDTTKPILNAPADIFQEASAINSNVNIGEATASDIFDVSIANNAPANYSLGETFITWSATDSNGNSSYAQQVISIGDSTAPILTVPANMIVEASDIRSLVDIGLATASDIFAVDLSHNAPADFALGDTLVTWTAVDANGNNSTATQNIKLIDSTAPQLSLPDDISLEANARRMQIDIGQATASDIFDFNISHDAPADYGVGETIINWRALDVNGNESQGVQSVRIEDSTAPVLTAPANIELEANARSMIVDFGNASASDIFDVSITHDAPAQFVLGEQIINWTATDTNDNVSRATQTVSIVDTTAPVVSAPASLIIEANARLSHVDTGMASATDIFDTTVTHDAPASFPLGDTVINWSATDGSGNIGQATQNIHVQDTTAPVLSMPANIIVEASAIFSPVIIGQATATDIFNVSLSNNGLNAYPLGDTVVSWKAEDENGNISSGTQMVKVIDTTKPVLQIPANIVMEATGEFTMVNIGQATANDIFTLNISHNAPLEYPLGSTEIIWTARDINGNSQSAMQTVTIVDTTAPTFDANVERDEIWPPNHKMIHALSIENVSDLVDQQPIVDIQISSNGDHPRHTEKADWEIEQHDDEWQVYLRAEKISKHEDRIYSIDVSVTDFSGNVATQHIEILVPAKHHKNDRKHVKKAHKKDGKTARKHQREEGRNKGHKHDHRAK